MTLPLVGISEFLVTPAGTAQFTVNTAVDSVGITQVSAIAFQDATTANEVVFGDNIFLQSIRFQLPYAFGNGNITDKTNWGMEYHLTFDDGIANGNINEFGALGQNRFPSFNCDFPINSLVYTAPQIRFNWELRGELVSGSVSMFNVPDDLNGDTFDIDVYLKVRHTIRLT